MLKQIIQHINLQIDGLGMFDKIHELCEVINEVKVNEGGELELTYPAEYQKSGELQKVDLSAVQSILYSRRNGDVIIGANDEDYVSCRTLIESTFPISYIGTVIGCGDDDPYKSERIVEDIIHTIQEDDNRTLVTLINADSIAIQPVGYSVNRQTILTTEFSGSKVKLDYKTVIFRIDLEITVISDKDCYVISNCDCDE